MVPKLYQSWKWRWFGAVIGMIGCLGWTLLIGSAQAADFTVESVIGVANTADAMAQDWQKLVEQMLVKTGNFVRTDVGASVELRGTDDSQLSIAEATQLLVKEFDFDIDQQVRVAKFEVLEGTVTADAAHLAYATNVFEVETPTVIASFKFSKLTIQVDKDGNTELIPLSGMFEFLQIGTTGRVAVRHLSRKGVRTNFDIPTGGNVGFQSTETGITISNIGDTPLNVTIGDRTIEMPPKTHIEASPSDEQTKVRNTPDSSEGPPAGTTNEPVLNAGTTPPVLPPTGTVTKVSTTMNAISKGVTSTSVPATSGGVASDSTIELPPPAPREEPRTIWIKIRVVKE